MPFDCQHRRAFGADACLSECPATGSRAFQYARVERPGDVPAPDARTVDVALLDMHHGWPNLGHDALVHAVQDMVCDVREALVSRGMALRVLSYDVRRGHAIPEPPGRRHSIYVGTGGPGHLDPRRNDGRDPGSQGIAEDPGWEEPLFRLFDAIVADPGAALLGVCHTFGVMCRWLGIADATLRPEAKGGKSAGIVDNLLTGEALAHPWFARFSGQLPDHRHFPVLDNRLYDLVPRGAFGGVVPLAYETLGHGGPAGEALTMIELARDPSDEVPRVLAVNHHPEIVNRDRQITALRKQRDRGDVTDNWYAERLRTLMQPIEDEFGDRLLTLTSSYTLLAPLRAQVSRALLRRADGLGVPFTEGELPLRVVYDLGADAPLSSR